MPAEFDWVEIALDYRCNLRCLGCKANEDTGESLAPKEVLSILNDARAHGVEGLWIGGGEPTLRPELGSIVATGRKLGFTRILLQTNGMRLAYGGYAAALVRAGVSEFRFNVKSHRADLNDALTGVPGSQDLLLAGIANAAGLGAGLSADVLLTRSTAPELAATIDSFAARGIGSFTLWLLSAADSTEAAVKSEVPSFAELEEPLRHAFEAARARGIELFSLHTPPCTLAPEHRDQYLPARKLRLLVVDPSGRSFPLETSPFEGGTYAERCADCSSRAECAGLRADHVRLHGSDGLTPLARPFAGSNR